MHRIWMYPESDTKNRNIKLSFEHIDCERGWYGVNCNETCGHCRDMDQCSNTNGTCLTGCDAGFQGELCNTSMLRFQILSRRLGCR